MMEGEGEGGEAAATGTSARSLAGAACGDMAVGKQKYGTQHDHVTFLIHFYY